MYEELKKIKLSEISDKSIVQKAIDMITIFG